MLAACDRQVDAGFQGDSLMRIRASVAIPLGLEGADLVPAIAFDAISPVQGEDACWRYREKRFVEVGVTGDFPSNFMLDVFDPPPPEVMRHPKNGPAYAVGTVTALPRRHPDVLMVQPSDNETFQEWRQLDIDTCYVEDEYGEYVNKSDAACMVLHACTSDGERCLHRELSCESDGGFIDFDECEVVDSNGDEALGVAGYSVNYSVMYFDGPVEAGTRTADVYAGGEAIAAGYHLYRFQLPSQRLPNPCYFEVYGEAAERYNAEHGTDWEPSYFTALPPFPGESVTLEEQNAFVCEVSRLLAEGDCTPIEGSYEEVGTESISIELGALSPSTFR